MSLAARFLRGLWEFVVGDDWSAAACVVVSIAVTAAVAGAGLAAWWVIPVGVAVFLAISLRR